MEGVESEVSRVESQNLDRKAHAAACVFARTLVEPRAPLLADRLDRPRLAEAIRHPLGDPPLDAQSRGNVPGVKRRRQLRRQQPAEVGRRVKLLDAEHRHQPLVFHLMIVPPPPPPPAVAREAQLFDLDEHALRAPAADAERRA